MGNLCLVVPRRDYSGARRARRRDGQFAVLLPILLLFVMMVVEFGNFYEHRRHLQFQADAGALAGAGLFNHCFTDDTGNLAIANGSITDQARLYAGAHATAVNQQVGNATARITARINKKTYEVGGPPADDTVENQPCAARMLDVKMTEADLPFVLRGIASLFGSVFGDKDVDSINARARIEIQELNVLGNSLPLAVPDPNPRLMAITLINENNGDILGTVQLVDSGISGTVRQWRNADPIPVTSRRPGRGSGSVCTWAGRPRRRAATISSTARAASRSSTARAPRRAHPS